MDSQVTTFWPMWSGMASNAQAEKMMFVPRPSARSLTDARSSRKVSLSKFEAAGGLLSGTETSRGKISLQRPNRQWE
jgi:alpha,alpha-trehalase